MKFEKGNMFEEADGPVFVTTSGYLKKDGSLIMNRGAALNCAEENSDLPLFFGKEARKRGVRKLNSYGKKYLNYGIIYDDATDNGIFQTKLHFMDSIDLEVLRRSASMLAGASRVLGQVNVNFPGCSLDDREKVVKILAEEMAEDDIIIWRLDASTYDKKTEVEVNTGETVEATNNEPVRFGIFDNV